MTGIDFDQAAAEERLLRFLAVEGITGQEGAIAQDVIRALVEGGVPRKAIHFDKAHEQIPLPTPCGNLIVTLPGTQPGPRLLFMTHLDTVPLCAGVKPVRQKGRIVSASKTALGGDNRTGVAVLVTLATTLLQNKIPHPPLTLLFTVREESGLWGARFVDVDALEKPVMGFNVDGREATAITIGAVGAERWEVDIFGRAAHAGAHPEQGISSTMVAAVALENIRSQGWFGKIVQGSEQGTSNVGIFGGGDGKSAGDATNVVTDHVYIKGEARSHNRRFIRSITNAYRDAFLQAADKVVNVKGKKAKVKFRTRLDYYPFRLKQTAAVIQRAKAAAQSIDLEADLRISNGGLDANWIVRHGIPTITIGAGQNNIHTVEEFVDLPEFAAGCRMALALATVE